MGHDAGCGAVPHEHLRLPVTRQSHRGASHHSAVGGDAIGLVHQARRVGWRMTDLQLLDDPACQDAHAAAILSRPGNQPPGKAADIVASLQQRLAEVHRLRQVVVHWTDRLPRVDVGHTIVVTPVDLAVVPALDGES